MTRPSPRRWSAPAPLAGHGRWPVAALYVDADGPYADLVEGGAYGVERDARTYAGPWPVVAHPPCGPWGRYGNRCNQAADLALHAVAAVRRWGGVLEHPASSRLFGEVGIPTSPWSLDRPVDAWGGYTLRLPQADFGHRAEKATVIYVVGTDELPPLPVQLDVVPHPVERMGKLERRLTPPAFAWWLCVVAARCRYATL